ncbi:MAG: hypothetical protein H6707_04240 [Deltaproteobacteria bacterium]|nr:hypothetical protein [Deltaproteobacteria bacterium]
MSANKSITIEHLRCASAERLEAIYAAPHSAPAPSGLYRCIDLGPTPANGARWAKLAVTLFFQLELAIDFDRRCWLIGPCRWATGEFSLPCQPSRWRATETYCFDYRETRLPEPIRCLLYDEVKPLTEGLCLGLGGINADAGRGDLRYFALVRQ